MSYPKRLIALAVVPLVFLAGCSGDSKDDKSSSSSTSSTSSAASNASATSSASSITAPVTNSNINDVTVDTKNAAKPTVAIKGKLPFGTKNAATKVLTQGTGAAIGDKDYAKVDYVLVNGTTGKTIGSTFGQRVSSFNMADTTLPPGLLTALKGKKVGTKMVLSLPPSQGFGSAGYSQLGIGPNDNIVFYLDVKSKEAAQKDCSTPSSDPSLPTVSVPSDVKKAATITFPKGKSAPDTLTCSVLKKGAGATVKSGQTVSVNYTGQIWNGAVFDATAKHTQDGNKPSEFPIGLGQVIAGWDRTLVGKKVGDRVLIIVPPQDGYGAQGNPQAGIKPTDTLVFVVDIKAVK